MNDNEKKKDEVNTSNQEKQESILDCQPKKQHINFDQNRDRKLSPHLQAFFNK